MVSTSLNIDQAVEKIKELPTLPDVVFKVNEVVNDPNTSAVDLENVISHDQAIAAKVLKLVNSAFYGLPGRVDTLARAIPLLGFSTVRNLVLSVSIFDLVTIGGFDMKDFWRHSFATSVAASTIAKADGLPDAESLSLAGLLHDIGKVLLLKSFTNEYRAVVDMMNKKQITFLQAERSLYQTDHAEVGAAIAEKWGFPPNITAAIGYHHNPDMAGDMSDFTSIVASANVLCTINEDAYLIEGNQETAAESVEPLHPLSEKAYRLILRELDKQMQFFENFIDRMEVFRRPSPLLLEEERKAKGESSIWKLPGE